MNVENGCARSPLAPTPIVRTLFRPRPDQQIAVVSCSGHRVALTVLSEYIELEPHEATALACALFDAAMAATDYRVASVGQVGIDE